MKSKEIIGARVNVGSYEQFMDSIHAMYGVSSFVCVANSHMLVEAKLDSDFADVLEAAQLVLPDGMPLVFASRILGESDQERAAGMDVLPDLLQRLNVEGKRIFLYGDTEDMLATICLKIETTYPNIGVSSFSPPFRALSEKENQEVIEMISSSGAGMVCVALGCPKQEKWMFENFSKLEACMIGLGGAFGVFAGLHSRAPLWAQRIGMEWLYRLLQEPSRLWKRYLVTNSLFVYFFAVQLLRKVFGFSESR